MRRASAAVLRFEALDLIAQRGYDPTFGARHVCTFQCQVSPHMSTYLFWMLREISGDLACPSNSCVLLVLLQAYQALHRGKRRDSLGSEGFGG